MSNRRIVTFLILLITQVRLGYTQMRRRWSCPFNQTTRAIRDVLTARTPNKTIAKLLSFRFRLLFNAILRARIARSAYSDFYRCAIFALSIVGSGLICSLICKFGGIILSKIQLRCIRVFQITKVAHLRTLLTRGSQLLGRWSGFAVPRRFADHLSSWWSKDWKVLPFLITSILQMTLRSDLLGYFCSIKVL